MAQETVMGRISQGLKDEVCGCLASWGTPLPPDSWTLLDNYVHDVLEYNRKVNITAARDIETLLNRHILDGMAPIAPLRALLQGTPPRILDVGAGAGFTGFGIKIGWPEADVTLMESSYRKYCFLNLASARMAVPGLTVLQERAGPRTSGGYEAVLARALAPLPDAVRLLIPLARKGGITLIYQSERPDPGTAELRGALDHTGASFLETLSYRLPHETDDRHLAALRRNT